jgi:uncharacterized protein (TIGR03790 family)
MPRLILVLGLVMYACRASADGLTPDRVGVIYNRDDTVSTAVAKYYAARRNIPGQNLVGLPVPDRAVINRAELSGMRIAMNAELPAAVQSLVLIWSRPYAVECMSITTAMAAGYHADFCEPGCGRTMRNPLFDTAGWLPADTIGWQPAMLLPTGNEALARAIIERGMQSDASSPPGTAYLVRTQDAARNVRAAGYRDTVEMMSHRIAIREIATPVTGTIPDVIAYFTGVKRAAEMRQLEFRPGAVADHLTSAGGVLERASQMSALEWLEQGATGSYGSVSEPCNNPGKFPSPSVFLTHYLAGETLLEAYWKSVEMPGQGLFIGEPLAAPYRTPK